MSSVQWVKAHAQERFGIEALTDHGPLATRTATATATQMCPLFPNLGLKRLLVFRSNLNLGVYEVVLFNCITWKSCF